MLFNKINNGSAELKELLGFIYASNNFGNIKTDILLAEEDMAKTIGKEVFKLADDHYNSAFYKQNQVPDGQIAEDTAKYKRLDVLVNTLQLPISFYGYYSYAPHADLTHSDKGRQIVVTDTEKAAFEWQIVRDSAGVLAKAHKTTDRLIEFLDSQADNEIATAWRASEAFKTSRELFILNASEFDRFFPIDGSRRLFLKMVPFMRELERNFIKPALKPELFTTLKDRIRTDFKDIAPEEKAKNLEIIDAIKPALGLLTMAMAVKRLSVEVLPEGLFQNYVSERLTINGKLPAASDVRRELAASLEADGLKELKALENIISKQNTEAAGEIFEPQDLTERIDPREKYFRL